MSTISQFFHSRSSVLNKKKNITSSVQLLMTASPRHAAAKGSARTRWMVSGVSVKTDGVALPARPQICATSTSARMRVCVCRMGTTTPVPVASNTLGTAAS